MLKYSKWIMPKLYPEKQNITKYLVGAPGLKFGSNHSCYKSSKWKVEVIEGMKKRILTGKEAHSPPYYQDQDDVPFHLNGIVEMILGSSHMYVEQHQPISFAGFEASGRLAHRVGRCSQCSHLACWIEGQTGWSCPILELYWLYQKRKRASAVSRTLSHGSRHEIQL